MSQLHMCNLDMIHSYFEWKKINKINYLNSQKNVKILNIDPHLNNAVNGFESGTGIFRTRVPAGRKLRSAMCVERFPNSQS